MLFFLISEKYRDLIDAADTISTMATIVSDITNVTEHILKTTQINQNATLDWYVKIIMLKILKYPIGFSLLFNTVKTTYLISLPLNLNF